MPKHSPQELVIGLLCRPTEPVFIPKGLKGVTFEVMYMKSLEYTTPDIDVRMDSQGDPSSQGELFHRSTLQQLKREAKFSVFIPQHRKLATDLIEIFLGKESFDKFIEEATHLRDEINPFLFVYAFSVALLHRQDTKQIPLPSLYEMFPGTFLDGKKIASAQLQANILPETKRPTLVIPKDFTGNYLSFEHRLAYFREDLGLSIHHWNWHLKYPFDGPEKIVVKDRRGELFYYMHHQIIARYNCERLCNNMALLKRNFSFDEPIEVGYFPKLCEPFTSRSWAGRSAGSKLSDIRREEELNVFDLDDLKRWKDQIIEAIQLGRVVNEKGDIFQLDEKDGIDILGNIIEPCPILSKNYSLYGGLHNFAHLAIALCHDPDGRYMEEVSVMGATITAARDPVFYLWHAFIDYIFEMHKNTLPPYTNKELAYDGIRIQDVKVKCGDFEQILHTFWETAEINLSYGLDFTPVGRNNVEMSRLQHSPFTYTIEVENSRGRPCKGTVRIFLAPKYDEKGQRMRFIDQKRLFIELDKFTVELKASPEKNVIQRQSTESNVTMDPFKTSFVEFEKNSITMQTTSEDFCGCGWPQNLLIPKGDGKGFQCQLFVMVSNFDDDEVGGSDIGDSGECFKGNTYCGLRNRKYPDRRAMGFPFDRLAGVDTLEQFVKPNMCIANVDIIFGM